MTTFLGILILVCALFLIVSVLLQSSKDHRLSGTIAGGAETFFGKQKGKTIDAVLSKVTAVISVIFCILVLVLYIITARGTNKAEDATAPIVLDDTSITTTIPEEATETEEAPATEEVAETEEAVEATEEAPATEEATEEVAETEEVATEETATEEAAE